MFVADVAAGADTQAKVDPVHPRTVPPVDGTLTKLVVPEADW